MDWIFSVEIKDAIAVLAILEAVAIGLLLWAMRYERETSVIWRGRYEDSMIRYRELLRGDAQEEDYAGPPEYTGGRFKTGRP